MKLASQIVCLVGVGILAGVAYSATLVDPPIELRAPIAPQQQLPSSRQPHILAPVRHIGSENTFGFLGRVVVLDDWLLVIDYQPLNRHGDQLLIVEIETGEIVHTAGPKGQGPHEIASPVSADTIPGRRRKFFVSDDINARLLVYDADDLGSGWTSEPELVITNRDAQLVFELEWLGDDLIVANSGNFRDELLRFYRPADGEHDLRYQFSSGTPWFPEEPPLVSARLSSNLLAASPSRERIAIASKWTNRLEVYSADGSFIRAFSGPKEVIPKFRVQDGWRVRPDHDAGYRSAYVDVAATDDYVIGVFSGQTQPSAFLGVELHVFTWDGQLVAVMGLDEPVAFAELSEDGSNLFGVRMDPYPAIAVYDLPLSPIDH